MVSRGAITHIEIDSRFDKHEREHAMHGYVKLDRENKLYWILPPHFKFFALIKPSYTPPHILFIGEGPGEFEDNTGKPFWGPAGHVFDKVLHQTESTFYFTITNAVCCRPTKHMNNKQGKAYIANRQPTPEEIGACASHVDEIVSYYDFQGIISLGEIGGKVRAKYPLEHIHLKHPSWILRQDYHLIPCVEQAMEIDDFVLKASGTDHYVYQ